MASTSQSDGQPCQPVRDEGGVGFSKKTQLEQILTDFGSSRLFTTRSVRPEERRNEDKNRTLCRGDEDIFIYTEILYHLQTNISLKRTLHHRLKQRHISVIYFKRLNQNKQFYNIWQKSIKISLCMFTL